MAWHNVLESVAAVLLLAIGGPLLWAAWRARTSRPGGSARRSFNTSSTAATLVLIAAGLSYAAAAIHFAVAPEHFTESAPEGIAFGVLALFQVATGALLLFGPSDRIKVAVIAVNLGATLMWALTRTTGVPFISELAFPEAIALRDVAATVFEIGLALILLALPWMRGLSIRLAPIASMGLVPVLGLVGLFTLLAVAGPTPLHTH